MILAAAVSGLALGQPAGARDRDHGLFGATDMLQPGTLVDRRERGMTAAQAAREAQKRYGGGKVLSVDPTGDGFRVKLLRDGDVRIVIIPDR